MRNFLKISFLITLIILVSFKVYAGNIDAGKDLCRDDRTHVMGFFNGMNNDKDEANDNKKALKDIFHTRNYLCEVSSGGGSNSYICEENAPMEYELFYNTSYSIQKDLIELIIQKGLEAGHGAALDKYFENILLIMNDILNSPESSEIFFDSLKGQYVSPASVKWLREKLQNNEMETIVKIFNNHTLPDYQKHYDKLIGIGISGKKPFLVGHSQGTLFMNKAVENVTDKLLYVPLPRFYVAPVTDRVVEQSGNIDPYILNDGDFAINMLRLLYPSSIKTPNLVGDGHGFTEDYIEDGSEGKKRLKTFFARHVGFTNFARYHSVGAAISIEFPEYLPEWKYLMIFYDYPNLFIETPDGQILWGNNDYSGIMFTNFGIGFGCYDSYYPPKTGNYKLYMQMPCIVAPEFEMMHPFGVGFHGYWTNGEGDGWLKQIPFPIPLIKCERDDEGLVITPPQQYHVTDFTIEEISSTRGAKYVIK